MTAEIEINHKTLLMINSEWVLRKTHAELSELCLSLADRCRDLLERLNKNSLNSSISPSTFIPGRVANDDSFECPDLNENTQVKEAAPKVRKKREHGFGRTIQLPITEIIDLFPLECHACHHPFSDEDHMNARCYTAFSQVDLEVSKTSLGGLIGVNRQSRLYESDCPQCETVTRYQVPRQATSEEKIILTSWRLIGSKLSSVIAYLKNSIGMSFRKIQDVLNQLFGILLSVGTLCKNLHETGLSAEPVTEELKEAILKSELIHVDETGWPERKKHLWLWVFTSLNVCLFLIGGRTKKMAQSILKDKSYKNWLMSDGYHAYREYQKRFRCWAHLERKAKGIRETTWIDGMNFGDFVLKYFGCFKSAIYKARESETPTQSIRLHFTQEIADFKETCQRYVDSPHKSTASLAKEFLYDWESIFRVLDYPHFPLTNNLAERALRHWVIVRKITQGTRTPIGSKTTAILASIIATCKLRQTNIIDFVQGTITAARRGTQMPLFATVRDVNIKQQRK